MQSLKCEMCGSNSIVKQDELFVCQNCGCKYKIEDLTKDGLLSALGKTKKMENERLLRYCRILIENNDYKQAEQVCCEYLKSNPEDGLAYEILLLCEARANYDDLLEKPRDLNRYKNYKKVHKYGSPDLIQKYEKIQNAYYEGEYQKGIALINELKEYNLTAAEYIFRFLSDKGYKDSKEIYLNIESKIAELRAKVSHLPNTQATFDSSTFIELSKNGFVRFCSSIDLTVWCEYDFWDIRKLFIKYESPYVEICIEGFNKTMGVEYTYSAMQYENIPTDAMKILKDLAQRIRLTGNTSCQIDRLIEKAGGCYVATCVYGSYDCPEVWTLRRYRDEQLGSTRRGRAFIKLYYAISPKLVKMFGKTKWFKKMWKGKLDRMVKKLNDSGVENTPYNDKDWN